MTKATCFPTAGLKFSSSGVWATGFQSKSLIYLVYIWTEIWKLSLIFAALCDLLQAAFRSARNTPSDVSKSHMSFFFPLICTSSHFNGCWQILGFLWQFCGGLWLFSPVMTDPRTVLGALRRPEQVNECRCRGDDLAHPWPFFITTAHHSWQMALGEHRQHGCLHHALFHVC